MTTSLRSFALAVALAAAVLLLRPATATAAPAPVAAVFLVDGTWPFMGNDTYARAEDCREPPPGTPCRIVKVTTGAHRQLAAAFGKGSRSIGARLGRKARTALVVYGLRPRVLVSMGAARRVTGKSLGAQRAFTGVAGRDLAAGLDAALAMVREVDAARRVVIVIGSSSQRATELEAVKAQFVAAGVPVIFLELHADAALAPYDEAEAARVRALLGSGDDGSHAEALASPDAVPAALQAAIDRGIAE